MTGSSSLFIELGLLGSPSTLKELKDSNLHLDTYVSALPIELNSLKDSSHRKHGIYLVFQRAKISPRGKSLPDRAPMVEHRLPYISNNYQFSSSKVTRYIDHQSVVYVMHRKVYKCIPPESGSKIDDQSV